MEVRLLTSTATIAEMEENAAYGVLSCHANTGRMEAEGYEPSTTLKNIIKAGHESQLEHITLTYAVEGLSRACLQELARHRHISLSVESTRHTLRKQCTKDFVKEKFPFGDGDYTLNYWKYIEACHFYIFATDHEKLKNDELKYFIPEFWPTNLMLTSNIRELRHIIALRSTPQALEEFQILALKLYEAIPDDFKYLLEGCLYDKH